MGRDIERLQLLKFYQRQKLSNFFFSFLGIKLEKINSNNKNTFHFHPNVSPIIVSTQQGLIFVIHILQTFYIQFKCILSYFLGQVEKFQLSQFASQAPGDPFIQITRPILIHIVSKKVCNLHTTEDTSVVKQEHISKRYMIHSQAFRTIKILGMVQVQKYTLKINLTRKTIQQKWDPLLF